MTIGHVVTDVLVAKPRSTLSADSTGAYILKTPKTDSNSRCLVQHGIPVTNLAVSILLLEIIYAIDNYLNDFG